jgi:hypothetical protein
LRQRQSQAGSFIFSGQGAINLAEGRQGNWDILGRNANSLICH